MICNGGQHTEKCSLCATYDGYFSPQKPKSVIIDYSNRLILSQFCTFQKYNTIDNLSETCRRYPKMCYTCKNRVRKYHLRSRESSVYDESDVSDCRRCTCIRRDNLSSLAHQLHQKLSRTLDANSNFFQKCIDCGDVTR